MTELIRVNYARRRRVLELTFDNGLEDALSAEFLRVHSPSAEVRGHGPGQEVLQTGKQEVEITDIQPVGHYALQLIFSDGHDSGIYTWRYLHDLLVHKTELWQSYLERLEKDGGSRDPNVQVVKFSP